MNKLHGVAGVILLVAACSSPREDRSTGRADNRVEPRPIPRAVARTPTVDPKSPRAAEELVRAFATLLEDGRVDDAYMLLGSGAPPRRSFASDFEALRDIHVAVQSASDPQGAAGSVYISVPLTLSASRDGKRIRRSGKALLRRVNDVPGSTEAQRHWHIERIDWDS